MSAAACTVIKTEIYRQLLPQLLDLNCKKRELLKGGFNGCVKPQCHGKEGKFSDSKFAIFLVAMDRIISCLIRCTPSTELHL